MEQNNETKTVEPATTEPVNEPAKTTEKMFTQAELNEHIKKAKGKVEIQKAAGRSELLKELGYDSIEDITTVLSGVDILKEENNKYKTELTEMKTAQLNSSYDSLFKEHNIEDQTIKDKMLKLASLETGEDKVANLKTTLTEFAGISIAKVGADTSKAPSTKPKSKLRF